MPNGYPVLGTRSSRVRTADPLVGDPGHATFRMGYVAAARGWSAGDAIVAKMLFLEAYECHEK
ncbi:MAG: hypothetical protein NVSMB42_27390 [Herpetosiphon sp.]